MYHVSSDHASVASQDASSIKRTLLTDNIAISVASRRELVAECNPARLGLGSFWTPRQRLHHASIQTLSSPATLSHLRYPTSHSYAPKPLDNLSDLARERLETSAQKLHPRYLPPYRSL